MSAPKCWDAATYPFRYLVVAAITDVADIITNLRTELTALGWTEPVADTFQCPVNAEGQYMRIACVATTPRRLLLTVTDHWGLTICSREVDINDPGTTDVYLFTGSDHVFINVNRATPEEFVAFRGVAFPDDQKDLVYPIFANGYRDAAGSADGSWNWGYMYGVDLGVPTMNTVRTISVREWYNLDATPVPPRMPSGRYLFDTIGVVQNMWPSSLVQRTCFIPQMAWGSSAPAAGTEYTVPIGGGSTGIFKRVTFNAGAPASAWWVRKA